MAHEVGSEERLSRVFVLSSAKDNREGAENRKQLVYQLRENLAILSKMHLIVELYVYLWLSLLL